MNIEVGKIYTTNYGVNVRVICVDGKHEDSEVLALVQPEEKMIHWFNKDGVRFSQPSMQIVAEYREPRTAYFVFKPGYERLFWDRSDADAHALKIDGRVGMMREVVE